MIKMTDSNHWTISDDGRSVSTTNPMDNKGKGWILRPQVDDNDPFVETVSGTVDVVSAGGEWVMSGLSSFREGKPLVVSTHPLLKNSRLVFWVSPGCDEDDPTVRVYWCIRGVSTTMTPTEENHLRTLNRSLWAFIVDAYNNGVRSEGVYVTPGFSTRAMNASEGRAVWAAVIGAGWVPGGGVPQGWMR